MRCALAATCFLLIASPVLADLGVETGSVWDTPATSVLTAANVTLAVANGAQITGGGSYRLGALGIATGLVTFIVSSQYDERSTTVDIPAALSIATGALSLVRRHTTVELGQGVSIAPAHSRSVYGLALNVKF